MSELPPKLPLLLYDDECELCKRFKQALIRIPGSENLTVRPLQDDSIYKHFPQLNKADCKETLHLLDEMGSVHKGGEALQFLVKLLPGVSKCAWLIESGMGQKTSDFFYKMVNHYRESLLNRCSKCKNRD